MDESDDKKTVEVKASGSGCGCCLIVVLAVTGLFGRLAWAIHMALGWPLLLAGAGVVVAALVVGKLLD